MAQKQKAPSGWGNLNIALNGLVKAKVIVSYNTGAGKDEAVSIEAVIDKGADQAEVVQRVRDALPEAFAAAQVRTRIG